MKEERPIFAKFEVLHLCNVERVIPGRMYVGDAGDEAGNSSVDERRACASHKWNLQILLRAPCEVRAQGLLVFRKYADAEPACTRKDPVHVRAIVQRDQYQRGS